MEYTATTITTATYPQMHPTQHQNPNPNPPQQQQQQQQQPISTSLYSSYYYPPPPPLPAADPQNQPIATQFYTPDPTTTLTPPGVDSSTTYPHLGDYFDPNSHTWAAKEAVRQYGSDPAAFPTPVCIPIPPNGTEQLAVAHPDPTSWANLTFQSQGNSIWKKPQKITQQKKTKVVQSAYCEVCKVDCNSKDVLDQHKLGKKHKKNLEKLQAAAAGCSVSAGSSNPVIRSQTSKSENGNGQRSKKKASELLEDLDTKRRKILEGGAAAEAVRACSICNVVCNSETVFNCHLAGQKHATMLKKLAAGIRGATAT